MQEARKSSDRDRGFKMDLKTNDSLLSSLVRAALDSKPSAQELHKQRVSFVHSALKSNSNVTRAQIENVLAAQSGK